MKRVLSLLLMMSLLLAGMAVAQAEDVCSIDVSTTWDTVSTTQSYVRLTCPLPEEAEVNVSIYDADGNLHYQRNYGACSGSFRSEDIYLRTSGDNTTYQVNVSAGSANYTLDVVRCLPRLTDNAACSVGYPLSNLTGRNSWKSVTLLDVAQLEGTSQTVALHASGAYTLGSVTFSVRNGQLTVSASIADDVDGSIDKATVYVAFNAADAAALDDKHFAGAKGALGDHIDLQGASCVAVYVKMSVSFDPTDVPDSPVTELSGQDALWQRMLEITAAEAVG